MTPHTLRVLVVDDNESVRRSICQLLESQADIEVACEAVDGADAVIKAREHLPDVVLLDVTMPTMNGLEAAQVFKQEFPTMHIIIVSQHDSRGFRWAALAAGVSGYVVKSNAATELIPELRKLQHTRLPA
jgi:DNA-binding NarL/FixJ family response regulator